jgi:hypothetical protein
MPTTFELSNLNYQPVAKVVTKIQSGWLAQFRSQGWYSRLIQLGTGGCHSHSAMLRRNNGTADVLEMVEGGGGRAKPLEVYVADYPGIIDVFSPDLERWPEVDSHGAVEYMRTLTGRNYGLRGLIRLGAIKCPLVWHFFPFDEDDARDSGRAPFCSHAVCSAWRLGGGLDPVPRKPDDRTTPNDLTQSLFFRYEFTLQP